MVENRNLDQNHQVLYELAFGKRSSEELYDCQKDPQQLTNLADDPDYAEIKKKLSDQLMEELLATADPRATGGGDDFDTVTYLGHSPRHPSYKP